MKGIILAAGRGSRLRPLTDDRPKCMVEYQGKPILSYVIDAMQACGVNDISVIKGYLPEKIARSDVKHYVNERYASTNMVATLFCAEAEMDDDLIISYSDIIYGGRTLQPLIDAKGDFAVLVDRDWKKQWEERMEDPLSDAETLRLNDSGHIVELGKKPTSYDDIEAQYMGLIKISKAALPKIREFYHGLDAAADYDGKDFSNMYMTTFIQLVIDRLMPVSAVSVYGGWMEVDCVDDLNYQVEL